MDWDRPSGPWEGPVIRWADGASEHGSGFLLFVGPTAQAVALELDAVSVVNDAVQYCVTEGWVSVALNRSNSL